MRFFPVSSHIVLMQIKQYWVALHDAIVFGQQYLIMQALGCPADPVHGFLSGRFPNPYRGDPIQRCDGRDTIWHDPLAGRNQCGNCPQEMRDATTDACQSHC
jgi:hypothetical protein